MFIGKDNYVANITGEPIFGSVPYPMNGKVGVDKPLNVGYYHKYIHFAFISSLK